MQTAVDDSYISELMLAKGVLEDGNLYLEQADAGLADLRGRERALRAELAEQRVEAARLSTRLGRAAAVGREGGVLDAVRGALAAVESLEDLPQAQAFVSYLCERHGVWAITEAALPLDPVYHRVIEHRLGRPAGIEVLRRGYRTASHVVRAALVRVILDPAGA